ncbi:hypothetical protein D3C83_02300 [compost metagenome]
MNRAEHHLREHPGDDDGDGDGERHRHERVFERVGELAAHQDRRHPDADRAEHLVVGDEVLAHLERLSVAAEDDLELLGRHRIGHLRQIAGQRQRAPDHGRVAVHDDSAARVDDGGVEDALAVDARLDDRLQPRVGPQRRVRVAGVDLHVGDAVEDLVDQHRRAGVALVDDDGAEPRDVERAERHDRDRDDGGDAGDLLRADAQAHGVTSRRHAFRLDALTGPNA